MKNRETDDMKNLNRRADTAPDVKRTDEVRGKEYNDRDMSRADHDYDKDNKNENEPGREKVRGGDTLGISDSRGDLPGPKPKPGGGSPDGIDLGNRSTGTGEMGQHKGATGIDMGAGGQGTGIKGR